MTNSYELQIQELTDEAEAQQKSLRAQLTKQGKEKDALQREIQQATDFIMEVQDKCYQSHQQSLDLLSSLKDNEEEVEVISEQKATPKKKTVKKSAKKKQTVKKKS